jgi:uncharacterized protein YdcH (DUF465 family)
MYEGRIKHLEESHRVLDQKIDALEKTGKFDDVQMSNLKKQRLIFRDELVIIRRKQWEHDHESIDYDEER